MPFKDNTVTEQSSSKADNTSNAVSDPNDVISTDLKSKHNVIVKNEGSMRIYAYVVKSKTINV